jgi:hypothetical protein
LGRRAQLSPGVGGASAAGQEGREKGTRVEAGEPPPFSPLSLSLSMQAGRPRAGAQLGGLIGGGRPREMKQMETTKQMKNIAISKQTIAYHRLY